MVKGITRQVIVVQGTDPKLFEQAIFILREDAKELTERQLLQEAKKAARSGRNQKCRNFIGPMWAGAGAAVTGLAWWICSLL